MPTLRDVLDHKAALSRADADWLHRLVGDWQMVADLSFSDLTLWVPTDDPPDDWVLVAHARPTTGPNFYHDDVVGNTPDPGRREILDQVLRTIRPVDPPQAESVREQYVPVVRAGRAVGVLVRHTDLHSMRQQGGLEVNYVQLAQALLRMIGQGAFPSELAPTGVGRGTPRVGDGVLRLDADGLIEYASPNGISALRRLGHTDQVAGADLSEIVTARLPTGVTLDETMPLVLTGRAPWGTEIETVRINLTLRAVPLLDHGSRYGAMILLRDVSELRRRERELMTKDATIREIHHRVKNNLQTVSALLRLQSRRMGDAGARAALQEAGRRVATVALVHDTLSHGFDETVLFDEIAVRIARATVEVASQGGARVAAEHRGTFGRIRAEDATPLAMILAELVHNAVEHAFDTSRPTEDGAPVGTVVVEASRAEATRAGDQPTSAPGGDLLTVTVSDDGRGLPEGHQPGTGLGMQIVQALIGDLRGEISWETQEPHGTVVRFVVRLRGLSAES
ncbi:sensor histidine kinase [Ornithinimicrobium cavernae]|uniref:sensor histidine kinase n=1 Tax=Ornithinimicrobium cavernae TaxID=2666047 RepID=UPI000D68F69E|nr:PAS domain-containing sensor histidine kinase [Ornithinimicrobium cavernae]